MNNEFCKECNNILYPKNDMSEDTMMLICKSCDGVQESSSYKIYATYFKPRNYGFNTFAKDLAHDPTLPKIKKVCDKCKNDTAVYFQNRDTEEEVAFDLAYICTKCYNYWS